MASSLTSEDICTVRMCFICHTITPNTWYSMFYQNFCGVPTYTATRFSTVVRYVLFYTLHCIQEMAKGGQYTWLVRFTQVSCKQIITKTFHKEYLERTTSASSGFHKVLFPYVANRNCSLLSVIQRVALLSYVWHDK